MGRGRGKYRGGRGQKFLDEKKEHIEAKSDQVGTSKIKERGRHRVINTIVGEYVRGGSTKSARKRHLHTIKSVIHVMTTSAKRSLPSITFIDADFVGVNPEQNDPIVIRAKLPTGMLEKF